MTAVIRNIAIVLGALLVCTSAVSDEQFVAATFSKAASYVLNTDFIYQPVTESFTDEELLVLGEYQEELVSMIQSAYRGSHSIGAALLTAHFKLEMNIELLKAQLLRPGTVYGWEGPTYDIEEDYLTDNQFVYHSVYLRAIEETAGRPIHEAIRLTDYEIEELFRYMGSSDYPHYHWATWLARKLLLLEPPR